MKKTTEPVSTAESLPTFLDEGPARGSATAAADDTATATAGGAETTDAAADVATDADTDGTATIDGAEPAAELATPAAEASTERRGRRAPRQPASGGGTFVTALGIAALVGAGALPLLPTAATALAAFGLGPAMLAVGGLVLCGAGMQARRLARLQHRLDLANLERADTMQSLHQELRGLITARNPEDDQGADHQQHLLLAVQRQDDKVNNLTKAIKMYGKPMMEIANQGTELAGTMATVKTLVEGGAESTRQALTRMETQLRTNQAALKQEVGELQQGLLKLASKLDQVGTKGDAPFAPMQQKLGQLEVAIAAIAQRLEDSEVRKSLLRLEETATKERETLQQLLRADAVRQASTELQGQLDRATRGLTEGLTQLRENNLGGLENAVRDIQREVSGVATTVAQINATVKSGARVTAAPTPTAAPAAAPQGPAPTPSPTPAPAATTPAGEPGGYQTGTRASTGKNVLGAIAKLKQMKT